MPQCDTPLVCGLTIHSAFMLSAAQTLTLTLILALSFVRFPKSLILLFSSARSLRPNPTLLLLLLLVVESVQL
jgi:hypothetical protein